MSTETTMTPPELKHPPNNRMMNPEPRNISIAQIAAALDAGQTVSVQWEPGDATRYDFLLVPVWSEHIDALSLGFASDKRVQREFLYLINAQDCDAIIGTTVQRNGYYGKLIEGSHDARGPYRAQWSARLFEWWFENFIWPRLDALRGVRA